MKPYIYKPHWSHDPALDKSRCLASVADGGRSVGHHQCSRKPWQDGWCKQHHPDSVAKRQEESARQFEKKRKLTLSYRYGEVLEKLTVLRAENARLRIVLANLVTVFIGSFGDAPAAQRVAEGFPVIQDARAILEDQCSP